MTGEFGDIESDMKKTTELYNNFKKLSEELASKAHELIERTEWHRKQYESLGKYIDEMERVLDNLPFKFDGDGKVSLICEKPTDEMSESEARKYYGEGTQEMFQMGATVHEHGKSEIEGVKELKEIDGILQAQNDSIKAEYEFKCSICGRNDFKNRTALVSHSKTCKGPKALVIHRTKTRECPVCHRQINTVGFWKHEKFCIKKDDQEVLSKISVQEKAPISTNLEVPTGTNIEVPAVAPKPKAIPEHKKGAPEIGHIRKCIACGMTISENAAHPYCEKCWKLTTKRPKHDGKHSAVIIP